MFCQRVFKLDVKNVEYLFSYLNVVIYSNDNLESIQRGKFSSVWNFKCINFVKYLEFENIFFIFVFCDNKVWYK